MQKHTAALVAVGVISDQLITDRHGASPPVTTGDAGFDRFALLLLATNPQQAFLQPLVDQHLSRLIEHDAHTDHLEGQGLGSIGHGPAAGISGSVSSAVGLPGAARAAGWQGVQSVAPRSIKAWLCPGAAADQAGPRSKTRRASSRLAGVDGPSKALCCVAVQDRQPKIEGTGEDAACSGAAMPGNAIHCSKLGAKARNQQLRRLMQPAGRE